MLTVPFSLLQRLRDPDGGFTWQPFTGELASQGYAVAAFPGREETTTSAAAIHGGVEAFVHRNWRVLYHPMTYLGAWHNPATGDVHLDISLVVPTEEEARALCQRYNQIAYYDFAQGRSVEMTPAERIKEVA